MDVNPPASSEEGKSDGFSSKTKRTYVIGVVDTTGMKSVNSNRKRRWDQPPDKDGDDAPSKVIVREVESDTTAPDQLTMVCEGDPDMEDYDAQYNECVNSNNLASDGASDEPILEDTPSIPISDVDGSAVVCTEKEVTDSQLDIPKNPSLVNSEPENLPPPPVVERPIAPPKEIRGRTDPPNSSSTHARDGEKPNSEKASKMVGKVEDKKVAKPVKAIPVAGIISDSLKQIQFCYDEDSNSTVDSEVDSKIETIEPNETIVAEKEVDVAVDETKIAKVAVDIIVDETKIAKEAVDIIVDETKIAKEAVDIIVDETKIAKEAVDIIVDETKIAKEAVDIIVDETKIAKEAVDIIVNETKIDKEAGNILDETKTAKEAVDIIVNETKIDKEAVDIVVGESKIANEAVDETKIAKPAINPTEVKDLEQLKLPRRSPTPVLNDEVISLSEDGMNQNERCAIVDSKTEADEVILQSETAISTEVQDAGVNSSNVDSIAPVENSSMSITDTEISELKVKNIDSIDSAEINSASPFCEPPGEKILLAVQCDEVELPKKELFDDQISHADEKTPLLPISNEVPSKTLEGSDSPERAKVGEIEGGVMQNEVLAAQSKATEPNNEVSVQDVPSKTPGNLTIDQSSCGKQFTDSIECNSEPSLSKEMKMFMEESSENYMNITDDKLLTKDSDGTVAQNNLISMDNSQNCCVSFDDLSSLEKAPSKSPELELRYSDSEDSNKVNPEVTMHFASFRTPESATDAVPESDFEDTKDEPEKAIDPVPESDFEDTKDESEKAIDALISANPDLTGGAVELQENTMEMLDSLVRRSSEDDPSRIQLGEGMLSEDSLINEINQLPDNDDKKVVVPEESSEPVVRGGTSSDPKNKVESTVIDAVEIVDEKPKLPLVVADTDAPKSVSTAVTSGLSNPDEKLDSPGKIANEAGIERVPAKSECTSAEDDLSQGGEEEQKNDNVSSENILEVIFGSKQESRIQNIRSMKSETDSKVTQENVKEKKHVKGSSAIHIQTNDSSYSNDAQQSADDSKLQLNNEEIEIDNTEIVMVDPTKPLSGEDTDNDGDDGSSERESSVNDKAVVSTTITPVDDKTVAQSTSSCVSAVQSVPDEEVKVVKETLMEVGESESSDTRGSKTAKAEPVVSEPMDLDKPVEHVVGATTPSVLRMDESVVTKTKKETKASPIPAEASHSREPAVPVLIIKKQAKPSKKEGDKNVVETLLTCSPKAADNLVSDSSPPPRKSHNEGHHIETVQDSSVGSSSPKHSPITLRIYKDNLTVKTDLDSPKRNKSPMSSEFKSELSPKLRSPSVSENLSPQNKQLEFTLKIAKDVHTNYPKATMSPKNVSSPSSVWKSEVQIADSPSVPNKELDEVAKVTPSLPTRGRGRGRGRGATPKRGFGRGRRGASQGRIGVADESLKPNLETTEASSSFVGTDIVIKQEVLTEDEKSEGSSVGGPLTLQIHDMFKKIINKEAEDDSSLKRSLAGEVKTPSGVAPLTPIVRKRGRPRKSVQTPILVPEEMIMVKQEPTTPGYTTPVYTDGGEGDDGSSGTGRPKRTCRGRTKPIVVKKRKPRGGGAASAGLPRGASTPLPPIEIKEEITTTPVVPAVPTEATTLESSTPLPTVTPSPPVDKAGATPTPPARGRGSFKRPTPDRNTLSEKELAELQKIEAKKEKLRLDRIAKYEAKKAKKLAKKLKDEERRKRIAREKAEKAEAAAPQVFEEETRMSAPDSSSRGHTPAPHRILTGDGVLDESQNSISTPGDTNKGNKKGRMEISITDMDCLVKDVRVDELAEYQWQGSELFMIQEQISLYLGVKSFKRKYPGLKRRPVEAEERTFLEDSGLVPKSMCDLGLTAVGSAEILDIMFQDFPEKYEEFRKHVRDKQAREASYKQKAAIGLQRKDGTKVEPREQALEAVAAWNANLNRERREERRCALDLQTFTVHYPKLDRDNMKKPTPKVGLYPVAVIPGQFCDHYKKYTPNELMYFPVNTVLYGPLRPNERQRDSDDGSGSESSSSSSSSSSSGESSSESESEGDEPSKCKMCNGTKKKNKDSMPEVLLTCVQCKSCYHPTCKEFTPEMIIHLTKYEWQCTACKKCSKCRDPNLKDRIMCCQLCDRGYHLSCIGLKKMPEGRWHCTVCAYCSSCGSRNPGGSDWQHEFKKGEKGVKIYQRTLCTPCFKLWRKGKYCQLCSKCHSMKPEEDPTLIQCNSCDRWLHKDCYGSKYGLTNKLMSTSSIQCDYCVERITLGSHAINRSLIKV